MWRHLVGKGEKHGKTRGSPCMVDAISACCSFSI